MDELSISVSQLNAYVYDRLEEDALLEEVWVNGELSDIGVVNNNAFFTLKDEFASIECVIYSAQDFLDILIEGQSVFIKGSVNIYKRNARFKFTVTQMQVEGVGELYLLFEKTKQELEAQGVFSTDIKKDLPKYPQTIGIVTSGSGAVLHDIKNISTRRNPNIKLILYPVKVQGENSHLEVAHAIEFFNIKKNVDLIIVARGGGSLEDLFAFNTKEVVLSVYNSKIPIISAVGHETDVTLCDLAADLRAPTPSAAAELAIIPKEDILFSIDFLTNGILKNIKNIISDKRIMIADASSELNLKVLTAKISDCRNRIKYHKLEMKTTIKKLYKNNQMRYNICHAQLELLNPYCAFERGYAVCLNNDIRIKSINNVKIDDEIKILLKDGSVYAKVTNINGEK